MSYFRVEAEAYLKNDFFCFVNGTVQFKNFDSFKNSKKITK